MFAWLVGQSSEVVAQLVAYCVALSLDALQTQEGESEADALAMAVGLDLGQWWTPGVEYFSRLSKASILAAVSEGVSAAAADSLQGMKKQDLVTRAQSLFAGTGWLPVFFRGAWGSYRAPVAGE